MTCRVAEDFLDGIFEAVEAAAAGVAFVAFHDGGPLVRGHGAGAGIGEQVDQDIVGGQKEQVVVRGFEQLLALLQRVVQRMGSTLLMRKGSMMVFTGIGAFCGGFRTMKAHAIPLGGRGCDSSHMDSVRRVVAGPLPV